MATYASNVVSGYTLKLELTEGTLNLADNTSPVTWKLTLSCTSYYTQSNGHSYSLSVNGSVVAASSNVMLNFTGTNTTITIAQGTATVTHNADGTKSMPFSASLTGSGAYYSPSGTLSLSGNMTLATIPRASSISLANTSVALNGSATQTVTITRASTSFTHTVEWLIGSTVMATQTGVATSQVITPAQTAWLAKIPASMSATATCRVTTFNGTAQVGTPVTKTFTVTVPTTIKPTFTASVVRAANLTPDPGIYVQGFSGVTIGFTSSTPGSGATIKSWSITSPDGNASADSATPGNLVIATLNTVGARTFTLKLKDTRDQETTATASLTVVNGVSTLAFTSASVPFATDNTFTATRVATGMTHTITLTLGTRTWTSSSFATNLSQAISNTWADQLPTTDSGTVTATLKTYVGSTLIGQVAATYTVAVPSAAPFLPTVGNPTATRTGQTVLTGYIEDNNGVNIAFSSGAAGTGASLTRWTITSDDGNTQGTGTSGSLSIPTLWTAGTRTFTVTVTDSRGRTATKTVSVTVVAYTPPSITAVSAFRSTSAGAADLSNGTYLRAQATVTFTATGGNALTRTIAWKKQGASANTGSQTFTSGTAVTIGAGAITVVDNWLVTWTITDTLGYTATTTIMVQSGFRMIHAAPKFKSIAIGLVATLQNLLDIGLPTRIRQTLQVDGDTTLNKLTLATPLAITNIGDGTITNAKLATGIDAGKNTTGTLPAARIGVRSVTFDKLLVGTAPNLIPDPRMLSTTIWNATYRKDGGGYDGGNSLLIPANTAATLWAGSIGNSGQPIAANTRLLCEYWVTSTVDRAASTARLYGRWYDDAEGYTNWAVNNPALTADTPVRVSAELLVPTTRGTMPRGLFGFNTTAADGDITFSAPVVQVIPTASLTDATAASTLPSVTAHTSIRTLLQTVRNCLKWLVTAVTNASLLTTGTLPVARIADGTLPWAKLIAGNPPSIQAGVVTVSPSNSSAGNISVTLPKAFADANYAVALQVLNNSSPWIASTLLVTSVAAGTFGIRWNLAAATSTAAQIMWTAIKY